MTILSGQSGLRWTDTHLDSFATVGPKSARVAAALKLVDATMRDEVFKQARCLLSSYAPNSEVFEWPEVVELVTAATLAGGSPRVFIQALQDITEARKE